MASPNLRITFEIEPVVKLVCVANTCRFNMIDPGYGAHCNLKNVYITPYGACGTYEKRKDNEPHNQAQQENGPQD